MEAILQVLLQHGVLGIMVALLAAWIYFKDRQVTAERAAWSQQLKEAEERCDEQLTAERTRCDAIVRAEREGASLRVAAADEELKAEQRARVADAQKFTGLAIDLQKKAIDAAAAIRDTLREQRTLAATLERAVRSLEEHDD
jgi:hypothetical protein